MATNPGRTNLEAWWAHDESGTGTRADSHTTARTLTNNNAATNGTGKLSNGTDFENGSNQYLSRAYANIPVFGGGYTVCGWVKFESVGAIRRIVTIYSATASARAFLFYSGGTDLASFVPYNAAGGAAIASTLTWGSTFTTATWYFFAFWHDDAADSVGLRIDGGTPVTAATTSEPNATPAADFCIGQYSGAATLAMDGIVDETCVYSRVLTSDEIDWLYNGGSGRTYAETAATAGMVGARIVRSGIDGTRPSSGG